MEKGKKKPTKNLSSKIFSIIQSTFLIIVYGGFLQDDRLDRLSSQHLSELSYIMSGYPSTSSYVIQFQSSNER